MSKTDELWKAITSKTASIAVIGLGYVGLPTAISLAAAGYLVTGVDTSPKRVDRVNRGIWPLDPQEPVLPGMLSGVVPSGRLRARVACKHPKQYQVIIVAVPTPNDCIQLLLEAVAQTVAPLVSPPSLVIIESTLPPRATKGLVLPTLEGETGLKHGKGFWLAYCPERVSSGKLWENLIRLPRIIGGVTPTAGILAAALYTHQRRSSPLDVGGPLHRVDALTAEIVKLAENADRFVQLAFVNELAHICRELGADISLVRSMVNTCPGRSLLHPGPFVGGPCLEKDTLMLAKGSYLLYSAWQTNGVMPRKVVHDYVLPALEAAGVDRADATVVLLGMTYKEGTSDCRNAPAPKVQEALISAGIGDVLCHDPMMETCSSSHLGECLEGADCAVLLVAHEAYAYSDLDWGLLGKRMRTRILVDTRGVVPSGVGGFTVLKLGVGSDRAR